MTPLSSAISTADGAALGEVFARALARRDFGGLGQLLHPEIDFRALTPRRTWEPVGHTQALDVLRTWFGNCDVEQLACLETDSFADRHRVGYRFLGHRAGEPFVIEQQSYFSERDGRIDWIRIVCSGFRAV
jgi:hypothetical protein